jgi:hypothetical protein
MKMPVLVLGSFVLFSSLAPAGGKDDAKPVNLEKLNTAADEVDPFPVDGMNLLYATNGGGKFEVRLSKRAAATSAWPAGKVHRPFLSAAGHDCRSPFVLRGSTLFFSQNKIPDKKFEDLRNFDVYQATGERAPLALPLVNEVEDDLFPWISAKGKEFYFSRKTKEGWKLLVSSGPGAGAALGPIGKGREVGFEAGFHHATLSPSGLVMYLQGPVGEGRWGIFRSKRASLSGKWSEPEAVKSLDTSDGKQGNLAPSLTSDGNRLYFVSDRAGGKGGLDIWTIAVKDLK